MEAHVECGVPLSSYAAVRAALAEEHALADALAVQELDHGLWAGADLAWKQRLASDGELLGAYRSSLACAEDRMVRAVLPIDRDPIAWASFCAAFARAQDAGAFLDSTGLGQNDLSRLVRVWQRKVAEDPSLERKLVEARRAPTPLPRIAPAPKPPLQPTRTGPSDHPRPMAKITTPSSAPPPAPLLTVSPLPDAQQPGSTATPPPVPMAIPTFLRALPPPPPEPRAPRRGGTLALEGNLALRPTLPFQGAHPSPPPPPPQSVNPSPLPPRPQSVNPSPLPPPQTASPSPPSLSLTQYASLVVEWALWPERRADTLRRYGLSDLQKAAIDAAWTARLDLGAERERFVEACSTYRAWLLSNGSALPSAASPSSSPAVRR